MSQEDKLAVLQTLLRRVQARSVTRTQPRSHGASRVNEVSAAPSADDPTTAASTRRSAVQNAPSVIAAAQGLDAHTSGGAAPAAPQALFDAAPDAATTGAVEQDAIAVDGARFGELDDAERAEDASMPALTDGDLISDAADDADRGARGQLATSAQNEVAVPRPSLLPSGQPDEEQVPPSAPRMRQDDGRPESSPEADVLDERPITTPPESGRQVAAAREMVALVDDVLDDIDIAIDIPDAGEPGAGAPRRPLDSIDLTSPDVAESSPAPRLPEAVAPAAPHGFEPPAREPEPAAPAALLAEAPARELASAVQVPARLEPAAAAAVVTPALDEHEPRDLSWPPPVSEALGMRPSQRVNAPAQGSPASSHPPRLEVVEEPPRTGMLEPIAHLVDPFPPPAGAGGTARSSAPPAGRSSAPPAGRSSAPPVNRDAPASDAPPTQWSEAPPAAPPPLPSMIRSGAPDLIGSVRLMAAAPTGDRAPAVEIWASAHAPNVRSSEVATFVASVATFSPSTFGELLDASLGLGN